MKTQDELIQELIQELEAEGCQAEDLDDIVHTVFSRKASVVNNMGMPEQVRTLIEQGLSAKEIRNRRG